MTTMTTEHLGPPAATNHDRRARTAARAVAGFLGGFLLVNTYWGFGGRAGIAWVVGCDCVVPLAAVWVQEAAIVAGIGVVLARAGLWRPRLPQWIFRLGIWTMTLSFAAVALQNLLGDNTLQARLLFAPLAATLATLCALVARSRPQW